VFPTARKDDLTVRELPEETLVYDRRQNRAHCLNATAALVWRHCDGNTSLDELARIVSRELAIAGQSVVTLALEQLAHRRLLDEAPPPLPPAERLSRRDALKKLALTAAVLPLVLTVTPRVAAQTLSPDPATTSTSDPPPPTPVHISIDPTIVVQQGGRSTPAPQLTVPCRTKGQSCVAAASGQQGTCCPGLRCNGVFQNAGVCG
jgi:hypothetical protein